jgi:hypothetical protein
MQPLPDEVTRYLNLASSALQAARPCSTEWMHVAVKIRPGQSKSIILPFVPFWKLECEYFFDEVESKVFPYGSTL